MVRDFELSLNLRLNTPLAALDDPQAWKQARSKDNGLNCRAGLDPVSRCMADALANLDPGC